MHTLSGVVHRDIKVDNCLISKRGVAKLGDFGLAHILPSPNSSDQLFKGMGSRKYRAPEVVRDRSGSTGFSGFQADVSLLLHGAALHRDYYITLCGVSYCARNTAPGVGPWMCSVFTARGEAAG